MIQTVLYQTRPDGVKLFRTYSDSGLSLLQTGIGRVYDEAIDVEGSGHTYTEYDDGAELSPEQAYNVIVGGVNS